MLYPFHLPGFDKLSAAPDEAWIRKTRRRINAEFELGDGLVIEMGTQEVDRATVLGFLEELEEAGKANFYLKISKQASLRAFLESSGVHSLGVCRPAQLQFSPEELLLLGNLLAPSLDRALLTLVEAGASDLIKKLSTWFKVLDEGGKDRALSSVRRWLWGHLQEINELREDPTFPANLKGKSKLWSSQRMLSFSHLGSDFINMRNRLAVGLGELASDLNNKHADYKLAHAIIKAALLLNMDSSIRSDLENMEKTIRSNTRLRKRVRSGSGRGSGFTGIGLGILVIMIIRLLNSGGCFDSRGSYGFRYEAPEMKVAQSYLMDFDARKKLDSIMTKLENPSRFKGPDPADSLFAALLHGHRELNVSDDSLRGGNFKVTPETGTRVFARQLPNNSNSSYRPGKVLFVSEAKKDAVLFLHNSGEKRVVEHFYLRAGDEFLLDSLSPGYYKVFIYAGMAPGYDKPDTLEEQFLFYRSSNFRFNYPVVSFGIFQGAKKLKMDKIVISEDLRGRRQKVRN